MWYKNGLWEYSYGGVQLYDGIDIDRYCLSKDRSRVTVEVRLGNKLIVRLPAKFRFGDAVLQNVEVNSYREDIGAISTLLQGLEHRIDM